MIETNCNIKYVMETTDPGTPYGIYLNGGKGFRVEENTLWRPSSNGPELFNGARGIIVSNTGAISNQIYKNDLSNLFMGIQSQFENSGKDDDNKDVGLKLFCNASNTSSYDYWAVGKALAAANNQSYDRIGFAEFQELSVWNQQNQGNDIYSAGNIFSPVNGRTGDYQFKNDDADPVTYSYDNTSNAPANSEPTLISANVTAYAISASNSCLSQIGGGNNPTDLYTNLSNAQLALNSSALILNIWKDGGNANLDEEVQTTLPWEAYQQFNELIAESPYLSDEVLFETVNNPVFSSLMVKLIMVANPQCTRSTEIMQALEDRIPAMPQTYIDEIKAGEGTLSQLEILEGAVSADKHLLNQISEDIKRLYRADTENAWAMDSLLAFMSRQTDLTDKYELASLYYEFGLYTEMQAVFNNISNRNLNENQSTDYANFVSIMNIAKTAKEANLVSYFLAEEDITTLEGILTANRPFTSPLALSLLKQDSPEFVFEEEIIDLVEYSARMVQPKDKSAITVNSTAYTIFPNPAYDYITLSYNQQSKGDILYTISDGTGKILLQHNLATSDNSNQTELLIDLQSLKPGVYYFNLINNGQSLGIDKLIILE